MRRFLVSGWKEDVLRKLSALVAGLATLAILATPAQARSVEFISQHPVPHKFGGGFCYIDVPHVHNYGPEDPRMYRESRGRNYFVGDPAPFEYDGPRYSYYGAHPVAEAEVQFGHPVFCYIKGPHYHWYQPQPQAQAQFQLTGGAYWYIGNFPPAYYDDRPRYAVINDAYAPMPYARPVVDVQVAPAVVRAEITFGGPGWRASAIVGGPPAPVYVAPPPAPAPAVQIGVGINLGGQPGVVERREYIDERYRRDHGRHEGWRERRGEYDGPRRGPPSRFIAPGPAPVRAPLLVRGTPSSPMPRVAPTQQAPRRGPAQVQGPGTAPMRGPAQAQTHSPAPAPRREPAPAPGRGPAQAQGRDNQHRGPRQ